LRCVAFPKSKLSKDNEVHHRCYFPVASGLDRVGLSGHHSSVWCTQDDQVRRNNSLILTFRFSAAVATVSPKLLIVSWNSIANFLFTVSIVLYLLLPQYHDDDGIGNGQARAEEGCQKVGRATAQKENAQPSQSQTNRVLLTHDGKTTSVHGH
jgi:hypothetical protein